MKVFRVLSTSVSLRNLASGLCLALLVSCASSGGRPSSAVILRAAVDAPEHFVIGEHEGAALNEPTGGVECRSPMVDPRDGTRIQLVRSSGGEGDYEVPAGRYGVGPGEAIRLDCGTGRAIGVVRQK